MRLQHTLAFMLSEDTAQQDVISERKSRIEQTDAFERGASQVVDLDVSGTETVQLPYGCSFLYIRSSSGVQAAITIGGAQTIVTLTPRVMAGATGNDPQTIDGIFFLLGGVVTDLQLTNLEAEAARVEVVAAGVGVEPPPS